MTEYTPERAEPAGEDTEQLPAVEPADTTTKQQWWTLSRRRTLYWAAMIAMIVAGIQQGWITTEATGAWLDALGTAGPGMAAMMSAIAALIMALRHPTPDSV